MAERLPSWADQWLPGSCGCGARLARPACYCGDADHTVCARTGYDTGRCPEVRP